MFRPGVIALGLMACATALAQVPVADLASPPAGARHFTIVSSGGSHGESWSWTAPDGTRMSRESLNLRGQVFEIDAAGVVGADGMPRRLTVRGVTPQGDAAERFTIEDGRGRWQSPVDSGEAPYAAPRFYAFGGTIDLMAWFMERLLAAPDRTLDLLPGGQARAEKLTSIDVGEGAMRQTITAWAVSGLSNAPIPIWSDARGTFFGLNLGLAWLPQGYESAREPMEKAQNDALASRMTGLATQLARTPSAAVAFTNVQMYDAAARRFLPDHTVVISKDRIIAVGPSGTTTVPDGAERIEGRGMTLVPGLWDCHMHVFGDYAGLQELSMGVTSVRDPGNSDASTIEPARLLKVDGKTGSIAVGKTADLVLVEGDPSKRISDLRHTRIVVMDGKVMNADALREAAGFSGRPKTP